LAIVVNLEKESDPIICSRPNERIRTAWLNALAVGPSDRFGDGISLSCSKLESVCIGSSLGLRICQTVRERRDLVA
jgi:hypothetical protein